MAAILEAERDGSGARGAAAKVAQAGFDIAYSPYAQFIEEYFRA